MKEKTKYTSIGGSALIEGVMMRSATRTAIAVRRSGGGIVLKVTENKKANSVIPRIPLVRGIVSFVQSMRLSYSAMTYAADVAMEDAAEEAPPETKFEKFLTKLFGKTGMAILSAVFRPQPGDKAAISARMRELNEKRREKQPLDLPSAGSAFKRPEGHFAAALIDRAGLKGYTVGGAQVSEKHAGFVVNRGGATSKDVYELMMHVRNTVYEQFQVELTPEIIILPPDYKLVDDSPMPHRNRVTQNSEFGIQNS